MNRMYDLILKMVIEAYESYDYTEAENINKLLTILADTCNCPSNWRTIGDDLAAENWEDYTTASGRTVEPGWIEENILYGFI